MWVFMSWVLGTQSKLKGSEFLWIFKALPYSFCFKLLFLRDLKLRGDWVPSIPPLPRKRTSERRPCLSLLPHTGTLDYHHWTSHTALQHALPHLLSSCVFISCDSFCVIQETQRWKDQIPALHEVSSFSSSAQGPRVSLVQDLKKVNDKCACSISKDVAVLQPSSLHSPPQQWALRGSRMGEN